MYTKRDVEDVDTPKTPESGLEEVTVSGHTLRRRKASHQTEVIQYTNETIGK